MENQEILVVGTGRMGAVYVAALCAAGIPPDSIVVCSASVDRAATLAAKFGVRHRSDIGDCPGTAIVAVQPDRIPTVCRQLLSGGAKSVLVEKPGALSAAELNELAADIEHSGASAFMALNRRFLPSVAKARELIDADGGVVAFSFEFTDLEAHVLALRDEGTWQDINFSRWGFINPVHVIDLAFFLCGWPTELTPKRAGALAWHPAGSEFCGAGQAERGALFSYTATFSGAGRWRIDLSTRRRRLVLSPIETLQQQLTSSFELKQVVLDPEPAGSKPGTTGVLRDFLTPQGARQLPTVRDMVRTLSVVEQMFGYGEPGTDLGVHKRTNSVTV